MAQSCDCLGKSCLGHLKAYDSHVLTDFSVFYVPGVNISIW